MTSRLQNMPVELVKLRDLGILRDIDLYTVEAMNRRVTDTQAADAALLAACLAVRVVADSHICLKLSDITADMLAALSFDDQLAAGNLTAGVNELIEKTGADNLIDMSAGLIGAPQSSAPFVLHAQRLYLRRYWNYEQAVAEKLLAMRNDTDAAGRHYAVDHDLSSLGLNTEQEQAVEASINYKLTVISGGPGTGKTYTAARILYLLSRPCGGQPAPLIRMAAPTGKAADRLNASVRAAITELDAGPVVEDACTIERLLGYRYNSPYFRHDRNHPLPADIVLIDEASMMDLPKMSKLLEALSDNCRLILLGDMHQLASVAPGSVLADICASETMKDCVVELVESRRFEPGGLIDRVSKGVNGVSSPEEADALWNTLQENQGAEDDCGNSIEQNTLPEFLRDREGIADPDLAADIISGFAALTTAASPVEAFEALDTFRVLCAVRRGPHGMQTVNRLIELILSGQAVRTRGLSAEMPRWQRINPSKEFYSHRVIMVTRNDYALELFNGDVGIILQDQESEDPAALAAYFPGRESREDCRKVACHLLPEHQTAFAMTVHKAQGSEFENILIILPVRESSVVTKELIYTGLTRTRGSVKLWCSEEMFKSAAVQRVERSTGLLDQLDNR